MGQNGRRSGHRAEEGGCRGRPGCLMGVLGDSCLLPAAAASRRHGAAASSSRKSSCASFRCIRATLELWPLTPRSPKERARAAATQTASEETAANRPATLAIRQIFRARRLPGGPPAWWYMRDLPRLMATPRSPTTPRREQRARGHVWRHMNREEQRRKTRPGQAGGRPGTVKT